MDKLKDNPLKSLSEVCLKNFTNPVYKYQGSPDVIRSRSVVNSPDIFQTPMRDRIRKSLSPLVNDPDFLKSLDLKDNIKLPKSDVKETESRTTQTVHFAESVAIQTDTEEPPPVIETIDADTQTDKKKKSLCCSVQ